MHHAPGLATEPQTQARQHAGVVRNRQLYCWPAELRNEDLILSHEYHPYMAQVSSDDEDCCGFSPSLIGRGIAPLRSTTWAPGREYDKLPP